MRLPRARSGVKGRDRLGLNLEKLDLLKEDMLTRETEKERLGGGRKTRSRYHGGQERECFKKVAVGRVKC